MYRNEGGMVQQRATTFDCHWNSIESWVGTNKIKQKQTK